MCDCYLWHSVTLSESIPHDVMRFWEGDAMIFIHMWFIGLMERALVFGAEDCRLMAHQDDLICAAGRTMCLANFTARLLRACESYTLVCACALRLFSIVFLRCSLFSPQFTRCTVTVFRLVRPMPALGSGWLLCSRKGHCLLFAIPRTATQMLP